MFIMHVALQGCLRALDVPYGLTPDTGGHIKYLLELVDAAEARSGTLRQQIIVRQFHDDVLGAHYGRQRERISDRTDIVRIAGTTTGYVAKEDLRGELPVLADNLERHILNLDRRPDVIHAHYADAGQLAVEIKRRLGIPLIFTAHSLGRVKFDTLQDVRSQSVLKERIQTEENVIAHADRIIASSMDEAELQYGLYKNFRPELIRVNPPGCNLKAFSRCQSLDNSAHSERDKFLAKPDKPSILALARPVRKKNLAGLVHAYGRNKKLQEAANLVIYAGTRRSIDAEAAESRTVLIELFRLIDDYDLWGKVAIPKSHCQEDVPAIYRHAYEGGGVFANMALNEPFGLTFLEAAATGLPVVATNSGGPNDILERCENGHLVDPSDISGIGDALYNLISDKRAWTKASLNGRLASSYYAWERHARDYLSDVRWIASSSKMKGAKPSVDGFSRMLVCDIDNTLTGDRPALEKLTNWLTRNPSSAYGIATGRSLQSAMDIITQWDIPVPRFMITSVGSEIYWVLGNNFHHLERVNTWPPLGKDTWDPSGIDIALKELDWLHPQPAREQRAFKRSYFLDDPEMCAVVRAHLEAAGLSFELIYSHGRFLDLLPRGVSKGHAIHQVARSLGIDSADIWAAGDSGNDAHMLEMVGHPIIVGNHTAELAHLRHHAASYFAKSQYAAGVLEGLLQQPTRGRLHEA